MRHICRLINPPVRTKDSDCESCLLVWALRAHDHMTQPAGLDEGLFTADVKWLPLSGLAEEKTP